MLDFQTLPAGGHSTLKGFIEKAEYGWKIYAWKDVTVQKRFGGMEGFVKIPPQLEILAHGFQNKLNFADFSFYELL